MKTQYHNDKLKIKFFKQMIMIRSVELKILDLFTEGEIDGTTHICLGQEACAVGVVNALDKSKDIIFSNHRNHGHYIAYTNEISELLAELMGKKSGLCKGLGGSQHIHKNNFFSSGIQGGIVPAATGTAFAQKLKKTNAVTTVFLGDGTLGQGVVYECLNIASLWSLPILFVVEDNSYAQSTPTKVQLSGKIIDRSKPFQISSDEMDVKYVVDVYTKAKKAVELIRRTSKPFYLVLHTYRLGPHSKGSDYRSQEEIDMKSREDPLNTMKKEFDKDFIENIEQEVNKKINDAIEKIRKNDCYKYQDYCEENYE